MAGSAPRRPDGNACRRSASARRSESRATLVEERRDRDPGEHLGGRAHEPLREHDIAGKLARGHQVPMARVRIALPGAERAERLDPRTPQLRVVRREAQRPIAELERPLMVSAPRGLDRGVA